MLTDDRLANLMFLLSFPSLAVGCAVGGESMTTQGPPVIDPTTGGDDEDEATSSGSGGSRGDTSGGADAPGTTDDDGPMTTTMPPADSTTGEYVCMGMPPMLGPVGPICMQYIAHYNDCFYGGMQPYECVLIYEAYCQYDIDSSAMMYGQDCGTAVEELYVCLSQLPCEQIMDEMDDCPEQFAIIDMACVMM
jgi:hypothetical protein